MTTPVPPPPPGEPGRPPRSRRPGFVGPLFRWELVRLARRGQDARARFVLAGCLLVVLTGFTMVWFRGIPPRDLFFGTAQYLNIEQSARFGSGFSLTFVLGQLAILTLLTPVYAAGGIAKEKERKTYPFLLVSDLSNREIVFGKFLGRLCFLLGVMFAGLPVLAMTQVYGGVSLQFLLMSYLLNATTITLLAAIGVAAAAHAETFRGAMFRSYGLALLHALAGCGLHPIVSPFGIVVMMYGLLGESVVLFYALGFTYAGCQLASAVVAIGIAVRGVRHSRAEIQPRRPPPRRPPPRHRTRPRPPVAEPLRPEPNHSEVRSEVRRPAASDRVRRPREDHVSSPFARRPIDDDNPFLWKERHVSGLRRDEDDDSIRGFQIAGGVVVSLVVAFLAFAAVAVYLTTGGSRDGWEMIQRLLMLGGTVAVFAYLMTVGTSACGTVVRERARLTLESLLAVPESRSVILGAKWHACAVKGWWWGVPGGICLGLAGLATDSPVFAIPMAGYALSCGPFAVSYGLWLSVRCKAVTRAVLWFMPAAGGLVAVPVIAWISVDQGPIAIMASLAMAAVAVIVAAAAFWNAALAAFEADGR